MSGLIFFRFAVHLMTQSHNEKGKTTCPNSSIIQNHKFNQDATGMFLTLQAAFDTSFSEQNKHTQTNAHLQYRITKLLLKYHTYLAFGFCIKGKEQKKKIDRSSERDTLILPHVKSKECIKKSVPSDCLQ